MEEKTLLVIARKYNDIFYATYTREWNVSTHKKLLVISENIDYNSYPYQELFNDVKYIPFNSQSRFSQSKLLYDLYRIKDWLKSDFVSTSNVILLSHYFIIKLSVSNHIILLEDGLMNYRDDLKDNKIAKKIICKLLNINLSNLLKNIKYSYLLSPDDARYYYGEKIKLNINQRALIDKELINKIKGKKIFVGQPLYKSGYMSLNEYCSIVNYVISRYNIDFYLPHAYASNEENISSSILSLYNTKSTLEMIASSLNCSLYSFASSVLYTTKLLNPEMSNKLIHIAQLSQLDKYEIFSKAGVEIINLEEKVHN